MKVLLLGLGRANIAVAEYLTERGDDVYLYEDHPDRLSNRARDIVDTGQVREYTDTAYDLVVTSPGFPIDKPVIHRLADANIPIIDEVEFTFRELKNPPVIAVSGTNGKSTTVAIISTILRTAGFATFLGGNIAPGQPFSTALMHKPYEQYVLEVSSFQLMRIDTFRPHIAVLTNIATDHMNWHRDYNEYRHAKARLFMNQNADDYAVLNGEDAGVRALADATKARVFFFGQDEKGGAWANNNYHYRDEKIAPLGTSRLEGRHNMMNMLAAIAVAKILDVENKMIEKGIDSFNPLPHRLEEIGTFHGIRYINNSMCTNENAAIASLEAITGNKVVIAGGRMKGDVGDRYLEKIVEHAKACVIFGSNADYIVRFFNIKSYTMFAIAENMEDAVSKARKFADAGDTIMLNPGYASFDYFSDFLERGEAFRNAAKQD
ncbi:MAG: UDP-N-acetylmuramoyl-L-alanine--D-glutamate ligase [candidate division WOR-3 bacterium]|nr:MAG: UDP-N-acetylmuramoyl-L-alanine--D-glutamate ligase [candidate division WOR-3 bacterium]